MIFVRSAVYFLWFVGLSVALNVGILPALLLPRRFVRFAARAWCRGQLWGLRTIAGLSCEVRGEIPPPGALVAAKHMSMWDTLALFLLLGNVTIVLKRGLMLVPFYGWYALKLRFIFIDRRARISALRQLATRARAAVDRGESILIFPEGTRKSPGAAPDYKPGVAALYEQLGRACIPVALNSGLYWTGPAGFLKRPGKVIVQFLPAIPPGLKRRAFMATLEQRIETAMAGLLAEGGAPLRDRNTLAEQRP
ncbi:MAG TPA: lysophospholipid acyltransferase family protein [Rhizomicrobium sp.]